MVNFKRVKSEELISYEKIKKKDEKNIEIE